MSEVMEKTFSSVSGFIMNNLGSRNMDVSPGFHNLIRSIRKARSKTEEEKVIQKELGLLKLKLQQPDTSVAKIKEYLIRIMYCEVLGHTASFSYIHAIKLVQQGSLYTKRVGYLAISLFLHENHELILLLVNTIQRDLSSTNMLHNCMALSAVCKLIGSEMAPAVLPLVEEKLKHSKALVRKKAVLALRALYSKAPHMLQNPDALFKQALCDRDEAVANAALHLHSDLVKENPAAHKQLVRPLVAILRQVAGCKLSSDFEYHGVSAPWTQIRILRMLARLGTGDEHYSSLMYDLLDDIIQQTSTLSHNIAYAVQYECLITVATIHPQEQLLIKAAQCISKFLKSFNYNLKYMGICALSAVMKVFPSCAEEHQLTVIDCLDDADNTIRFKTLDLLFRMTTDSNVEVICGRLLTFLEETKDTFIRRDLLSKIIQLADKYQPSVHWYLDTMTQVLLTCGSLVPRPVVNNIIGAISKDARSGGDIGQHALRLYLPLISRTSTSNELLHISCWVLGEFAHLPSAPPATEILSVLCSLLDKRLDDDMKTWAMGALAKVVASCGAVSEDVVRVTEACKKGTSTELGQRACELQQLGNDMDLMREVHARPDSAQELQFDWTLSFLDEYVSDALARGAAPYKPKQQRHAERQQDTQGVVDVKPLFSGLNFVPYQSPTPSTTSGTATSISTPEGKIATKSVSPDPSLSSGASGNSAEPRMSERLTGLKLDGVRRVWGQKGCTKTTPTTKASYQPPARDSQSPTVNPSSPVRGVQPSVQLSTAIAVGRTTTSQVPSMEAPSEEDSRKKELAKALFGGLHKTMTTSSKKPLNRKPQYSSTTESTPKSSGMTPLTGELRDAKTPSRATDLLLLSDLDTPSSDVFPPGVESSEVQYGEENHDRKRPEEQGSQNLDGDCLSREDENVGNISKTDLNQEAQLLDEVKPGQGNEERTGSSESIPSGPHASTSGRHNGQQQSMYEEFKELALNEEPSGVQTEATKNDSSVLLDHALTNQGVPHGVDPQRLGDRLFNGDHAPTEDRTNHLLDIHSGTSLSDNSDQKADAYRADSSSKANSNLLSVSNSATHPVETKMSDSQMEQAKTASSLAKITKETSALDSSPDYAPLPSQPESPQILLPEDWQNYPRSKERVELCSDSMLGVTLYKVLRPDTLALAFHITNISPIDSVTEIRVTLDVSSNLKVSDNQRNSPLSIDVLDPSAMRVLSAQLVCVSPAPSMSLGGEVAYKDHTRTNRRLFFSSPILVSDLLRPLEMQTTEFGEQWPRQTRDCKFTAEVDAAVSMSKVMTLLTQALNLHLVEIIGNEGIACGTLLDGPVCLLHTKLPSSKSLELWVRSSSQLLSESVARLCREDALKKL